MEDGGPAFMYSGNPPVQSGISIRDYFAGKAVSSILSLIIDDTISTDKAAKIAYKVADSMIEARK